MVRRVGVGTGLPLGRMLGVGGVAVALLAMAGCSGPPVHEARAAPGSRTSSPAWIAALGRPGACASVRVVRRGRVVLGRVAGLGRDSADEALFDIGSAAKSVTAVAALRLVEQGRLDLSASISHYLPHVPIGDQPVTSAQLLSHSSGLPENFTSDQQRLTRAAAVRAILRLPRAHSGRFSYSNTGYTLLAAIVEAVAHQPFQAFVEREVLAPAGMTSTGWYGQSPAGTTPVEGHVNGRPTGPAGTQAPATWATLGAGGMTSTTTDMTRWLTAIASDTLLDRATTTLMFTPRAPIGQPDASAAYGWIVGNTATGPIRLVGGDTDYGYTSDLRILPRQSLETVALSCSTVTPAEELGHDLQVIST
jgi:CubicO group peptidase (beta-lactamase class C family)